jgi:hypothetical protein
VISYQAILCADWSGSPDGGREVYAAVPSTRTIQRLKPPRAGWKVEAVLDAAAAWSSGEGTVLVGFDAPIGMSRSHWDVLQKRGALGRHFAQWLDAVEDLEGFLDPVARPEDWKPERPFFRVAAGPGGLGRFQDAARTEGVELLRDIDRATGAKSPLIASGIPGVAGGSARDVWHGLKARRALPDPPFMWPFEASLAQEPSRRGLIVAEIYPRLATGIALGHGPGPWPIPPARPAPRQGLAELLGSEWVREYGVRFAGHEGFEDDQDAFDALISAAALYRLVLEGLAFSNAEAEDSVAEGGMLGAGAARLSRMGAGPDVATDARTRDEVELLKNLRRLAPELQALLTQCSDHWGYEDPVYRFYHQSFKVYGLQSQTEAIVARLTALLPGRPLNQWFLAIVREGTGHTFEMSHNQRWPEVGRPILEAFFHARFFLEMAVRYSALASPPRPLPSGYAALVNLFGLR